MRAEKRQEYLLEQAKTKGFVSIPETAKILGISVETVRRDITALCQKNLLKKVYGGAAPVQLSIRKDPEYFSRIHHSQQEKIAICKEAARMIRDGDVVTLDGGATTYALASTLSGISNVHFVVNSLPVANVLLDRISAGAISGSVTIIGGQLSTNSYAVTDIIAMDTIDQFRFDLAFISCSSLAAEGVANSTLSGPFVRRLMQRSNTSVLIADSEKVGKTSTYKFADLTDFDRIIIDNNHPCPEDVKATLRDTETTLTIIDCSNGGFGHEK